MTAPLDNTSNTAGWLTRGARLRGDQLAIVADRTGQRLTYAELDRWTDALARGLRLHGIENFDAYAVMPGHPLTPDILL